MRRVIPHGCTVKTGTEELRLGQDTGDEFSFAHKHF